MNEGLSFRLTHVKGENVLRVGTVPGLRAGASLRVKRVR